MHTCTHSHMHTRMHAQTHTHAHAHKVHYLHPDSYRIPNNISDSTLNYVTCEGYNRQGTQCNQCIDGYGPLVFSDGDSCADCSKHRHLWLLNLLFQLTMLTLFYLVFIPLQTSPLNIISICAQLSGIELKLGGGQHHKMGCYVGQTITYNHKPGFFHVVLPPLCVVNHSKQSTISSLIASLLSILCFSQFLFELNL